MAKEKFYALTVVCESCKKDLDATAISASKSRKLALIAYCKACNHTSAAVGDMNTVMKSLPGGPESDPGPSPRIHAELGLPIF